MQYKRSIWFVLILSLSSCTPLLTKIYGVKKVKSLDEEKIIKYCNKYNIPEQSCYWVDTNYLNHIFTKDTITSALSIKNHYQPIQVLYYGRDGYLKSYSVNCYAPGFPNLKWNKYGNFDAFPPAGLSPIDSLLQLNDQLSFLHKLSVSDSIDVDSNDFTVIVFWNRFMGRHSKSLIKTVQQNLLLVKDQKVSVIYVNNDNAFLESL